VAKGTGCLVAILITIPEITPERGAETITGESIKRISRAILYFLIVSISLIDVVTYKFNIKFKKG
jgi:hypothetical protein